MWKERFFYFILKWEFNYIDNLGKASALSTDQIDIENGLRYGITFVDENGEKQNPIILHNSPSGAIDDRDESLSKKIREAEMEWIHYIIIIGEKEVSNNIISIRDRINKSNYESTLEELIE